jgi:tetratricopeptide (TPR) repeat protein
MIQLLVIVVGILVLGSIYVRRYMMVEKGVSSFTFFGRKRGVLDLLTLRKDRDVLELTVEEIIPESSTIDPKKIAKADTFVKKADAALAKGEQRQGEKFLIQALALDPSNLAAYQKLGLLYLHQGQFGKAEMMYQKLVMSVQTDPVFFSNLAMAMFQQKKLEGAKTNYKKAIELDATRPGRFFSLGQVLKEMGEVQDALAHLRKAIEMDPANLDYLLTLAQTYLDLKMTDEARVLLGEILAAYPENEMAAEMMKKAAGDGGADAGANSAL